MTTPKLEVVLGDITTLDVEVIVTAANAQLVGGGGVDGAVHRAAGPELLEACSQLGGCETGSAKITSGFHLKATAVIHAVGPVWRGGNVGESELLASCYRTSIRLVEEGGYKTVAFPAISCGVYGYPKREAVEIAVCTVKSYLEGTAIEGVVFSVFDEGMLGIYSDLLSF